MKLMREMQKQIRESKNLVVVGGGAAGVELATDAKSKYPDKQVTLVHSRDSVMHRFGPKLQATATDGIKELGIELITGDRVVSEDKEKGIAVLRSGKEIACDYLSMVVAFNVLSGTEGKKPKVKYVPHWLDGVIKLTLGLDKSVSNVGDGKTEFLFPAKEKNEALMAGGPGIG
ncbi:hypothetical protein GL218_05307 [Daldinia childiae]|uniref:uncharacterized protein n=1 Tax=Daldinia childiae TaxID=326645 RepID=UPI0014482C85|nr:uncharacterized protein GL218_05307 [Daldinia childiae]KAF3058384.1 hypothetical protein GL218_05307 [Daldinia childiae]